jgi:hypothetical protein
MGEPSGGAERDFGGGGGNFGGVSGGVGGVGGSGASFGATNPSHSDTELALRPGFYDINSLDLATLAEGLKSGFLALDRSGQFAYSRDMAPNVSLANSIIGRGLGMLTGVTGPFSGFTGTAMKGAGLLAGALRDLGVTAPAGGLPGGTGEPGQAPAPSPAPSPALAQTALPPSGNPLLNIRGQSAGPGWLTPYLAGYSGPRPAGPASNQGLPAGQGMLGPLYA